MNGSDRRNLLLDALPDAEREILGTVARTVRFAQKDSIYEAGRPIEAVYFPLSGLASIVSEAADGVAVEAVAIGNEGLVGLQVYFDQAAEAGNVRAVCQASMEAIAVSSTHFADCVARLPALGRHVRAFAQAAFAFVTQSSLCNRNHELVQRCARWLLDTGDRVGDKMSLTQEFLAAMLGVHRPSVTIAMRTLEQANLIEYERGRVAIVQRSELEKASCECYAVTRAEYARLLPGPYPRQGD